MLYSLFVLLNYVVLQVMVGVLYGRFVILYVRFAISDLMFVILYVISVISCVKSVKLLPQPLKLPEVYQKLL